MMPSPQWICSTDATQPCPVEPHLTAACHNVRSRHGRGTEIPTHRSIALHALRVLLIKHKRSHAARVSDLIVPRYSDSTCVTTDRTWVTRPYLGDLWEGIRRSWRDMHDECIRILPSSLRLTHPRARISAKRSLFHSIDERAGLRLLTRKYCTVRERFRHALFAVYCAFAWYWF